MCMAAIAESSHPLQASFHPTTGSLPLGVTGGAAVAHGEQEADVCGYVGTSRFGWSRDKERARQAERRKTGLHVKKAEEGPKDHCAGPVCGQRCGNRHISRFQGVFVSSYFFFSAPSFSSFLSELFGEPQYARFLLLCVSG